MNRDDIIKMAREAGLAVILGEHASEYGNGTFENTPYPELERFAALVAAAEREACAKVCDFEVARLTAIDEPRPALAVGICAAAIRAKGQQ